MKLITYIKQRNSAIHAARVVFNAKTNQTNNINCSYGNENSSNNRNISEKHSNNKENQSNKIHAEKNNELQADEIILVLDDNEVKSNTQFKLYKWMYEKVMVHFLK
jgi:hypothetical protein